MYNLTYSPPSIPVFLVQLLNGAPTSFFEVSSKVQQLVGEGGMSLLLEREAFDANAVLGNPYATTATTTTETGAATTSGAGSGSGDAGALIGGGSFLPPVSTTHLHTSSSTATHAQSQSQAGALVSASSTMYPPAPSLTNSSTMHQHGLLGGQGQGQGLPPTAGAEESRLPAAAYPYKLLEINLLSVGHDSERLTSSIEVNHPTNQISN